MTLAQHGRKLLGSSAMIALAACETSTVPLPAPIAPLIAPGVEATWREARKCRSSHEHWLHAVRVVLNDAAWQPYNTWTPFAKDNLAFPAGSLVVKAEYDEPDCSHLIGYTLMRKEKAGYWTEGGDWQWQKLDAAGKVLIGGKLGKQCAHCHVAHCKPPNGFDLTCTPD